jgi:hypothetical protein
MTDSVRTHLSRPGAALLALAFLLALPAAALSQGVTVALDPPITNVHANDTFTLTLDVTQAGSAFNGFDCTVSYDPTALQFMPASPISQQIGSDMQNYCGSTFHQFSASGDSLKITDVLLCNGGFLTGPAQIYKLNFKALSVSQPTVVHIRYVQFYNAGLYVNPAYPSDAQVGIDYPLAVPPGTNSLRPLRIDASPNPSHGVTMLRLETNGAGEQNLEVLDVMGRTVRHLAGGSVGAGVRTVVWDGTNDQGARVGAGVYLARVRMGARSAQSRIAMLH